MNLLFNKIFQTLYKISRICCIFLCLSLIIIIMNELSTKALVQYLPTLAIGLTVVTTSLLYYWYRKRHTFVSVCKVKKLIIYPIKALKGIEVNHLEITENVCKYGKFKDRSVYRLVIYGLICFTSHSLFICN